MLHLKKINKSARLGYMCRKEAEYMLHLLISLYFFSPRTLKQKFAQVF
jgi:hypothetical protein